MPICFKVKKTQLHKEPEGEKVSKRQQAAERGMPPRPVVLSQKRFNLLKEHADTESAIKKEEENRLHREKMKLTAEMLGKLQRTPEQKLAEIKKAQEEKGEKARASLNASKAFHESLRKEKIAKAELLIQKLKCGPRELRSAAMQSEMLRARDVQLEVNNIIQESIKKQELADKAACKEQAVFFLGEGQERIQENQEKEKAYRAEMLQLIRENENMRCEDKKKAIEEGKKERAQMDAEIQAQIEKERKAIEMKRSILRKNAIEAMKMSEGRKKRNTMYDEVEDRLCCIFNAGRHQLEKLKSEQAKEFAVERQKQIEKNTEMLSRIQEQIRNNEAERLRRDISTMKLKFEAEEQEKRNREKELKKQRIEAHLKEMEQIRLGKEREAEAHRFEVAQRFKNAEVNARFVEADRLQQQQRAKCVRSQLMAQEEERQRRVRESKIRNRICDNKQNEKEDNFFFKYAHSLIEDASKKQRPLHPFKKVITEYKRSNMRDMEKRKLLRHMVTNVCVAHDTENDKGNAKICKKTEKPTTPRSKVKAETLEHMAKIEAMFAENERRLAAKGAKSCTPKEGKKDGLQQDCCSDTASVKFRYGIEELKQIRTAAPSLHC